MPKHHPEGNTMTTIASMISLLDTHSASFFSLFGKAFEQVAEKTGCAVALDYFDSTGTYDSLA